MSIDIFHDWNIIGVSVEGDIVSLRLKNEGKEKVLTFVGVSRCFMSDFLIQNIIYEIKILHEGDAGYAEAISKLDKAYPWPPIDEKNIAYISPSVGAEMIIEFSRLV